jgi:hypothetical protein
MEGVTREPVTPAEFLEGIYGNAMYLNEEMLTELKREAMDLVLTYYGEDPIPQGITQKLDGLKEVHGGL